MMGMYHKRILQEKHLASLKTELFEVRNAIESVVDKTVKVVRHRRGDLHHIKST